MANGLEAWRRRDVAVLICFALGLSGCGGGGGANGNIRSTPSSTPATTPTPTPTPTPAPSTPTPTPSPSIPTPPINAQLALTNATAAQNAGYTGQGITIGVVDTGIMSTNPAVAGRVAQEFIDVDPSTNNTAVQDVVGHGTWVSEIAAGKAYQQFAGGVAPGATLVSARIIDDNAPDDNGSTAASTVTGTDAAFFQQVNQQLIGAGVQVENNSWGGISWASTDTATTQAFDAAYAPFVEQHNGLVVFAAGNDSQANPSTIASLPTVANDANLQKGWLVAVALDSNNPSQLDSYSNRCGIAMNYCLAAPGDVIVLDKDTTASTADPTYYIVEGTSFAAPEVSGAAALVWQAYPYFSNALVAQTLLGTATPLGGSQPNPTYGYGALNVEAAVNGPEQFNWGNVEVGFSGTSSWNNPISGAGGLIMDGPGALTLSKASTYTGGTTVSGGTLNAVSLNSDATVNSSATLAITGTSTVGGAALINGSLTNNSGAVVVGSSNLTINGNYNQSGGRLAVPLGSALVANGTATLGNSAYLYVYGANSGYNTNSKTLVLSANQGLSGTFSGYQTASSVALTATLSYDANDAYLDVQQVNLSSIKGLNYSSATAAAAVQVQGVFNTINSALSGSGGAVSAATVNAAASIQQTQTAAAMQKSLDSLSGQMYAASAAMTFEAIDADTEALSNRFDSLLDHPQLMQQHGFNAWQQNLGNSGSFSRSGYDSLDFQLNGNMIGGDMNLGNGRVLGYAISQSNGLGNLAQSADQGYSRALEGMLYGGLVQGNWYAMGRIGFGNDWQDTRRQLLLGSQSVNAGSFSTGSYDVAYSESGYRFNAGRWKLTPYADLEYANVNHDGINELGGDGFGLQTQSQSIQRWMGGLGLRGSRSWLMADGSSVSVNARLSWQDAFAMRGLAPNASFTALNAFTPVEGIGISRYGTVAELGLNWQPNARSSVALAMNDYSAQREHAATGTLSYSLHF